MAHRPDSARQRHPERDLLKDELRVSANDVQWLFIDDYCDTPISGLALYHGTIYRFGCFKDDTPDQRTYLLFRLTDTQLAQALEDKQRFEAAVGTHWSFDRGGRPLPREMASAESRARYYASPKIPREWERWPDGHHPIAAWFDVIESSD